MSAPELPGHVVPGMFHTSHRLGRLVRLLRPLPRPVGEVVLAVMAMADGLVHPTRFRQATVWAAAQPGRAGPPWRLALATLATHGRFCAEEAFLGESTTAAIRRGVVLEGAEHLAGAGGGVILLGFHLGSPRTWFRLRALGYPVRLAGRLEASTRDPRWAEALAAGEAVRLPGGSARARLVGLYQVLELLRGGALVSLSADGPFGREAFRIALPGGDLVVRGGWLALRRMSRAPTLPVLAHRDGKRHVIVVHPPLPEPDPDPARDAARCQAVLAPLVEAYVRRFPAQCRYLAFPPWSTEPRAEGPPLDRAGGPTYSPSER